MTVADLVAPIAAGFGPAAVRSKPRVEIRDLLPLLKLRAIHAMLLTLLVVAQYWFQLASSIGQHPRVWFEAFIGMYAWNAGYYIAAFLIIAVVQARLSPGPARTVTLLCAGLGGV